LIRDKFLETSGVAFRRVLKRQLRRMILLPLYISYKDQGVLHLEWHQGTQTGPLVEPACCALSVPETALHLSKNPPATQSM
jgi:hypothetical protein